MNLRVKFILPLLGGAALFAAYLHGYWVKSSIAHSERAILLVTAGHLDSIAEGLIPPLLGHQLDVVHENLAALLRKNATWKDMRLVDHHGHQLFPLYGSAVRPLIPAPSWRVIERAIAYGGNDLGKLRLTVDFAPVLADERHAHYQLEATLFAGGLLFLLLVVGLLEIVVNRPVHSLLLATQRLARGDFGVELEVGSRDEVGALLASFLGMRDSIRSFQERLLRQHDQLATLSTAVDQSPVSIVITDVAGDIEYVNPRFSEVSGYSAQEVRGKNPRILKSDETSAEQHRQLWETITAGEVWYGTFQNRKKNGDPFWEYACVSPVFNEQGVITHYLGVKEDITARRRLELQLHQSQKMEAIGQLAGGIAHDFNNILAVIVGFAELARDGVDEQHPSHEDMVEVVAAAYRGTDLVRRILTFSRQTTDKTEPVEVEPIAQEAAKLLRASIPTTVEIVTDFGACGPVMANSTLLHQVLLNLGTNAAHAMERAGGTLAIALAEVAFASDARDIPAGLRPGDYARLRVTDTGCGIRDEILPYIFDPFFTTKDVGKGTGLGLSVLHGIVTKLGGAVTVASEIGQGATFTVYLPITAEYADADAHERVVALPRGTEHILLVDDEVSVAEVSRRALVDLGYTVTVRTSSTEALEVVRNSRVRFDLVLADQTMPRMTGLELARSVHEVWPELPVVLCTGFSSQLSEDSLAGAGVDIVLRKPILRQELAHAVRQMLDV
mgnify:CR=1 FL=1